MSQHPFLTLRNAVPMDSGLQDDDTVKTSIEPTYRALCTNGYAEILITYPVYSIGRIE